MSHTFIGKKNRYHFNQDMSGEIMIIVPSEDVNLDRKEARVAIDGEDLLSFMEEIIRGMKTSKLEKASLEELIG